MSEPTPEIAVDNAAATAAAGATLDTAINELVDKIKSGSARIDAATASAPAPQVAPVAPAPVYNEEKVRRDVEELGLPKGTEKLLLDFARNVVLPQQANALATAARARRTEALVDPKLAPLMKRYGTKVDEFIKSEGITDAYLAEKGYGRILSVLAAEDSDYEKERVEARAQELAKELAKPAASPSPTPHGRAPLETAAPPAPVRAAASATEEDELRSIEVNTQDEESARKLGLTVTDIRKQRLYERKVTKRYGERGLQVLGGMPVMDITEMGIPEGR